MRLLAASRHRVLPPGSERSPVTFVTDAGTTCPVLPGRGRRGCSLELCCAKPRLQLITLFLMSSAVPSLSCSPVALPCTWGQAAQAGAVCSPSRCRKADMERAGGCAVEGSQPLGSILWHSTGSDARRLLTVGIPVSRVSQCPGAAPGTLLWVGAGALGAVWCPPALSSLLWMLGPSLRFGLRGHLYPWRQAGAGHSVGQPPWLWWHLQGRPAGAALPASTPRTDKDVLILPMIHLASQEGSLFRS